MNQETANSTLKNINTYDKIPSIYPELDSILYHILLHILYIKVFTLFIFSGSNVIQEDYDYICFHYVYCDIMSVQKDAGELLLFFYDELIKHGKTLVKTPDVLEATKWDKNRIIVAYTYLKQLSLLKSFLSRKEGADLDITKNFYVRGLFPKAVNIVENEVNFEKTFGFKANLASLKFSWSTPIK